jgi:ubiquinone/menaquinone biosynthesis C-methylase UbiE
MPLSIAQWHHRYQQQAQWTRNIREYIYSQISLRPAHKILDVGCGTGVLENELINMTQSSTYALDIDFKTVKYAQAKNPRSAYIIGDSLQLPYPPGVFDVTLCHFLLLWVSDAVQSVKEMVRVTCPDGFVLALAEPDYGGRIDFPPDLIQLGRWQTESLQSQGANPFIGRELKAIFYQAGLINIEVGVLGGQWTEDDSDQDIESEWQMVLSDLEDNSEFIERTELLKEIDILSRQNHQRLLFVPTFYAFGMVKKEV